MKTLITTLFVLLLSTNLPAQSTVEVSQKDFPKQWCFTFTKGSLACVSGSLYIMVDAKETGYAGLTGYGNLVSYPLDKQADAKSQKNGKYFDGFDALQKVSKPNTGDLQFFIKKTKGLCGK